MSSDTVNTKVFYGYGTPEGAVTANVGSIYMRQDGGANTSLYRKETGGGNTGWVASTNVTLPLSVANGGLGVDASGWTVGDVIYVASTGVIGHTPVPKGLQVFTASGTFVAPTGVTTILLTMCGGGGGGQAGTAGGSLGGDAGGGAGAIVNWPYTVIPGNSYTVTVGAAGVGGTGTLGAVGSSGTLSSFAGGGYTITCNPGIGSATRTGGNVTIGASVGPAASVGGTGTVHSSQTGGTGGASQIDIGGAAGSAPGVNGISGNFGGGGGGGYGTGGGLATNGGNGGVAICVVQFQNA